MASLRDKLLQNATGYLLEKNKFTREGLLAYHTPDCLAYTLPEGAGIQPMDNESYVQFYTLTTDTFHELKVTLVEGTEPVVDEEARTVVMRVVSNATTDIGPYQGEYIYMLYFDNQGEKVYKVVDYVDWHKLHDYMTRLGKIPPPQQ